jgi:hypothetical protein
VWRSDRDWTRGRIDLVDKRQVSVYHQPHLHIAGFFYGEEVHGEVISWRMILGEAEAIPRRRHLTFVIDETLRIHDENVSKGTA